MKIKLTQLLPLLLFTSLGFGQDTKPQLPFHTQESEHSCSRLSNLNTLELNNYQQLNTFTSPTIDENCPNRMSAWAAYSGSSLVSKLKEVTDVDVCLRVLMSFDTGSGASLYSNSNIETVSRAVYDMSSSYDGTYNSGMLGLLTYLHAAVYHEFYQSSVSLNDNSKYWYGMAVEALSSNANLWNVNEESLTILGEYLVMCDYEGLRHKPGVFTALKDAIRNLVHKDNWKPIVDNEDLLYKYVTSYNKIFFLLYRGIQPVDPDYEAAAFQDKELIELIFLLGKDSELKSNKTLALIVNNSVAELTRMTKSDILKPEVEPYIAELAEYYPRLTANWYRAIKAINQGGNCQDYNLCEDMTAVREEVENILFPNTWTFDDGKLKVRTPLSYDEVQPLYYASKQVQSQFFRFLETDQPLADDPNPELNMILFGTMGAYHEWQNLLNNLPTNNGGIYIEKDATFYTYERTEEESSFTLEELFRHEYVHYLQGRYIEHGFWGKTDFYKNSRLTWFDEGMAEHFAGSTDSQGVRIRESQGFNVKSEGQYAYMTVNQILNATYSSGFKFYRYGNMLWNYWFKHDMYTARELINLVKSDDIEGFDRRINQLKTDSNLEYQYKNYLNNYVIKSENWWHVDTPWIQDELFTVSDIQDAQSEFNKITGLNANLTIDASTTIRRFKATFPLSNGDFDNQLNLIIENLKADDTVNNFDHIVAYYTDVNNSSATAVLTGSLRNLAVNDTPEAMFSANTLSTIEGGQVQFKNESTGYVKNYEWTFPGAYPATSTEENPNVVYNREGVYTVHLKAKSDKFGEDTESKVEYITILKNNVNEYCDATMGSQFGPAQIINVEIANLHNETNGLTDNGYADYTSEIVELIAGESYVLLVEMEQDWPTNHLTTWIDWNQDGDFQDENEKVMAKSGTIFNQKLVEVPANAKSGVTRMRVRYAIGDGKIPVPCGLDDYSGEIEDYSVLIYNVLSTEDNILKKELKLYPNPLNSDKILNIDNVKENSTLEIYNILGHKIKTKTFNTNQKIELKELKTGVYIYTIKSNDKIQNGKLIVK